MIALQQKRTGATLIEVLVSVAIAVLIISVTSSVFIQVLRESSLTRAEVSATTGARLAADKLARELQALQLDADNNYRQFVLINNTLPYGDYVDQDGDGIADEEEFNGLDTDGDWSLTDDRHGTTPFGPERHLFVGVADFGDAMVDEDTRFSRDEVIFIVPPTGSTPRLRVHYRLGSFDGVDHVLLRGVTTDPSVLPPFDEVVEPVLFDVVSFDVLAWNSNNDASGPVADAPYWAAEWNAATKIPPTKPLGSPDGTPPFLLPSAFLISVTTSAERVPLSELPPLDQGTPILTARISTVASVESVINSNLYNLFLRRP